jgi:sarcosine oxidase
VGAGVKVARHHLGETTTADGVNRTVSEREIAEMTSWVDEYLPDLENGWRRATVCLYTNTPDYHFLIDRHPEFGQMWIVSPCSGHGFKFASVIGELVADLIIEGGTDFDIRRFQLDRGRN